MEYSEGIRDLKDISYSTIVAAKISSKPRVYDKNKSSTERIKYLEDMLDTWEEIALSLASTADRLKQENFTYKDNIQVIFDRLKNMEV